MKFNPLIGVVLAIVVMVCLCLWLYNASPLAKKPGITPTISQAAAAPGLVAVRKDNPVKMVAIASQPKPQQPSMLKTDWSGIQLIVDGNASYQKRLDAINHLSAKLSDADWQTLQAFLLKGNSSDNGQLGQVVKNELLDALCAMTPPPDGLGDVLTRMYRDQGQNDVIRDYAIQHLAAYDEQLGNPKERQTVQDVLWSALNETGNSIAGTALLGLERLSQEDQQIDQSRIAQSALALADDNTAGELTHITAYQVCAQMNVQDALPTIEAAAQNGQTLSQQISAIGALGLLGGKDDLPLLQNLSQGSQARLQVPAQNAINRIEQRLQLQASAR